MRKKLKDNQTYFDIISSDDINYLNQKKIVVSDCDGVLTNGNAIYSIGGKIEKIFGAYDTEMITFMKTQGWEFLFVSRDPSGVDITKARINDMHEKLIIASALDRANIVKEYMQNNYIVLFVGDSLSDIQSMSLATYAACPNNAVEECKEYVDYSSRNNGGNGALGEILMYFHKKLQSNR